MAVITKTTQINYSSYRPISKTTQLNYASQKTIYKVSQIPFESRKQILSLARISYQPYSVGSTDLGVTPSAASDVLPQQGSAIYDSWVSKKHREITLQRHWDGHETGRVNYAETRSEWQLGMKVDRTTMNALLAFIIAHKGAGIPFYFYDLQHNNFQYDATGLLTDGRYLVRYVEESFSQQLLIGSRQFERFSISFSVIEVV